MAWSEETTKHLKEHVTWPATKEQIVAACNNMEHVSEEERNKFSAALPEGNYNNVDEVMKALPQE